MAIRIQAYSLMVVGPALAVAFGLGVFLPRRTWAWIYGIVLIALLRIYLMVNCVFWKSLSRLPARQSCFCSMNRWRVLERPKALL